MFLSLQQLEARALPSLSLVSSSFAPDHWRFTFSAQVAPRSLDWSDFTAFMGPSGPLDDSLNGFAVVKTDKRSVDVFFDDQTAAGAYTLTVGPGITSKSGDGMDAAVALTGTIAATPGAVFTDTFADGAIDSRWSVKGTGGGWVESGGVVSQTSTASGDPKKLVLTGVPTSAGATVKARIRVDSWSVGDGARAGIGILTDSSGLGYNLLFREGGVQFLDDYVRWGNFYSFNWSVGSWYNFALTFESGVLKGKVWSDGGAEPADWQFTQSGWTTHQSGSVALNGGSSFAGNGSATVSFDDVAVFDTPIPQPPPPPPPPTGGFHIDLQLTGFTPSQQLIFRQAADRWAQVIVGDLPDANFNGIVIDDLLIQGTSQPIDGQGGVLGQAGWDRARVLNGVVGLPYHGSTTFDTADLAWLESAGQLDEVILHEMSHVLGFGTIWSGFGLLSGSGTSDPIFTGAQATAEYNARFGTHAVGVPVENIGGAGTANSHWRESIFHAELMTGFLDSGVANLLSRITAASLWDLGYVVDMSAADPY